MSLGARFGLRRDGGFTLIETLASLVVLGALFTGFSMVFSSTIHHNNEIQQGSLLQTEVRAAVDRFASDLRQATAGGDANLTPVASLSSSAITFYAPDRLSPYHLRKIAYQLSGGNFQRAIAFSTNTSPPWTIPALGSWVTELGSVVNSAAFTFYDSNGAVTATPANVVTVGITLTIATITNAARQFTYSTSVSIRTAQ
jgi:prepilin-type N-terminal cleavage/methylation domain-containing protein